ncbi:hypothetical protein LSTR_LSTR012009 [Laodelphax striatellus]|uniref:SAM domain-containing protein n=1 Tax=Laodelphax striatellus TaxID=195883 RepID=A0A482WHH6_LAOST|nr:hypothetical protein LSTR_LSTR012009 [Laodelphax striatellus]
MAALSDPHTFLLDPLLKLKPVRFMEGELIHDLLTTIFVIFVTDSLSACGDPTYASIGERAGGGRSWSPLTEEGYAEKLRLLREAGQVPMERWRAPTVLAWLEIALGMPQYGPRCAENVKSGKVLLELSDVELECGLGITHPMHRKKLRLAIEEHRQPGLVRYPPIAQLGHTWVSSEWLPDLGLAQSL